MTTAAATASYLRTIGVADRYLSDPFRVWRPDTITEPTTDPTTHVVTPPPALLIWSGDLCIFNEETATGPTNREAGEHLVGNSHRAKCPWSGPVVRVGDVFELVDSDDPLLVLGTMYDVAGVEAKTAGVFRHLGLRSVERSEAIR